MELTNDLQKSSTINIADFYPKEAILPLLLRLSDLSEDKRLFYSNENSNNLKNSQVKKFYKYITKFY